MREAIKISFKLLLITALAGLALGVTYDITKSPIELQAQISATAARQAVLPEATEFINIADMENPIDLPEGIDTAYAGMKDGELVGYTAQTTVKGYGGNIEIVVGMGLDGLISGVNVGGSDFSETAGLGAKAKEPDFYEQFEGLKPEVVLNQDVDAITAATITSRAVTDGVNEVSAFVLTLLADFGGGNT